MPPEPNKVMEPSEPPLQFGSVGLIVAKPTAVGCVKVITVSSKGTADAVQKLEISNPRKWDIDHPELYKANISAEKWDRDK